MNSAKDFLDAIGAKYTEEDLALSKIEAGIISELMRYRRKNDLNQKALAKKLGVTQAMVSKLENGVFNLTFKQLNNIAFQLGGELSINFNLTSSTKEKTDVIDMNHIEDTWILDRIPRKKEHTVPLESFVYSEEV